ncbi:acyl-CoA dehydrogenase family protein [Calidifontibacillus erzurumensis]|uniref:Acyl-CoA dehydrogenase n=1 Tax=Calidifontibacillus erzurumensis TaxID=2741433 RepID=A0A8J8GDP1_9BACI|nr:acyl-CoA dehydrogenase family protein [Calidifontibacillus erzurumensis]NSL50508.1 acyl-CoA dehydrogenase family protein [Calidifontibacillus erzurumensis]
MVITKQELDIFLKTIRQFVKERIAPHAASIDENQKVPEDLMQEIRDMGLFGVAFPEKYGGSGIGWRAQLLMTEEIAKYEGSIPSIIGAHTTIAANSIYIAGTEEQKQKYLKPLAEGKYLGAFALTEPGAGSDAAGIQTKAIKTDNGWVLDGRKCFITNAPSADVFIVFAVNDPSKGSRGGITAFIVEKGAPGLTIGKIEHKMGIRGSETSDVILENVEVKDSQVLGEVGQGFRIAMRVMQNGRLNIAAISLGMAKGAFELALNYARERKQFGKTLSNFQSIQNKIAEMKMNIFAIESMLDRAITLMEEDKPFNLEGAILKAFASEKAEWIINEALQIYGGYGYMKDYPLERMLRDVRINRIFEGTSEIQRMVIAKEVFRNE